MLPLSQMLAILCLEYLVVKVLQNQLMSLQKSSTESLNVGRVGRSLAESVSRGQRVAQEMGRFDEV
jgi:hypothetical protein